MIFNSWKLTAGGRIVPRFQELTPEKLGKVCLYMFLYIVIRSIPGLMIMFMQLKAVQIDRTKIVYESNCSIVFDKYIEQLY
jgi:hypothetical protein